MLKEQHRFFRSVLIGADTLIIAVAAVGAYWLRFHLLAPIIPPIEQRFDYTSHAIPVLATVPLMTLAMIWTGLYRPRRDRRFAYEASAVIKAVIVGLLMTIAVLSLLQNILFEGRHYSGWQFVVYFLLANVLLITWRFVFRSVLRELRSRGWNQRHVAIVGTGRLGRVVCRTIQRNTWTGINPVFFISHHTNPRHVECLGLPVVGGLDDLERVLDERRPTGIFIALPGRRVAELPGLMIRLERCPVDVRIVPDTNPRHLPLNMSAHELDGMPVLSVRETPFSGWGRVTKRMLDIVGALLALALFSVPMAIIAILVRISGPGPIIFRQERMSLNGQRFKIFKFRTMSHVAAEQQTLSDAGKGVEAWTQRDDPRITAVGRILRRLSLDELPQLFNVLLGEMSLVGPRPERPELIARFRDDWRGYMLRQNVKAGMTGWAQVNGLRGDCSLKKRLQYDLFYIRNWSIRFDLRILWMTIFRGFAHPNAH